MKHMETARNMQRFHRLDIQPDLSGNRCLLREWGRIGGGSQVLRRPYSTGDEAQAALQRQQAKKEQRKYSASAFLPRIDITAASL
jgi:predicted DNA-binding WGR domain protein